MWRILSLPFLFMLTASAPSLGVPTLDMAKGVELVNAAPSDFRAILAAMLVLLFVQTLERWWAGFRAGKSNDKAAAAADKLSYAVNTMAAAQTQLAIEVRELARNRP